MYVRFDKKGLNIDVLVGVSETYVPREDLILIRKKADDLREQTIKFLNDTFNSVDQVEINKIISGNKELESKWIDFVNNKYLIEFNEINISIEHINKQEIIPV